jgi:hypothetical protein
MEKVEEAATLFACFSPAPLTVPSQICALIEVAEIVAPSISTTPGSPVAVLRRDACAPIDSSARLEGEGCTFENATRLDGWIYYSRVSPSFRFPLDLVKEGSTGSGTFTFIGSVDNHEQAFQFTLHFPGLPMPIGCLCLALCGIYLLVLELLDAFSFHPTYKRGSTSSTEGNVSRGFHYRFSPLSNSHCG